MSVRLALKRSAADELSPQPDQEEDTPTDELSEYEKQRLRNIKTRLIYHQNIINGLIVLPKSIAKFRAAYPARACSFLDVNLIRGHSL